MVTVENPLVSIIVNCFNGEKYLKRALQSILNQTYKNWEVIFWDNCSSDDSKKIFLEFQDSRFKYFISDKYTTLYEARNNAIKKSKGEILGFLDVDDWWDEKKLEKQITFFDDEKVGLVHSNCYLYYEYSKKKKIFHKKILRSGYITSDLCKEYNIGILTVLLRKKAFFSESGFNKVYNIIGDFDLFMRLSSNWKFISMKEPLAYCRVHDKSFSFLNREIEISEMEKWISDENIVSNKDLKPYLHYINNRITFIKTKKYINDKNFMKAIKNIIFYPISFNKIKLLIHLILPKIFFKR